MKQILILKNLKFVNDFLHDGKIIYPVKVYYVFHKQKKLAVLPYIRL
jgi:hypothetical protein